MERKKRFKKSILFSVLIPMILVLLMQSALFVTSIYAGGTVNELKQSSMRLLSELGRSRSDYLENEMISRWMEFSYPYDNVVATVDETLRAEGKAYADLEEVVREDGEPDAAFEARREESSRLNTTLVNALTPHLIDAIRISKLTGAFVAFGTDRTERKYGLYLRDESPDVQSSDKSIKVEIAPKDYDYQDFTLGKSDALQTKFSFGEGERDFFIRPYRAYRAHPEFSPQTLGWWSEPYYLNNRTFRVMTYSIPLLAPEGTCYGVMGVVVSESQIVGLLPGGELVSAEDYGVYILGRRDGEDGAYVSMIAGNNTNMFDGYRAEDASFSATAVENVYRLKFGKKSCYYAVYPIELYQAKTPFADERWQLSAFVYEDFVEAEAHSLQRMIFLMLGVSLLLGIALICFCAVMIVRPIMKLTAEVRSAKSADSLSFDRIGITEIDNLISAIEQMGQKVLNARDNLSKVIELSNMRIAAFEYDFDKNEFFVSSNFAQLINLDRTDTYEIQEFMSLMERLEPFCVSRSAEISIYKFTDVDGAERWIEVRFVNDADNPAHRLGVVADVTKEYGEKEQLRRELNFDPLTGIYNRRAFEEALDQLFVDRNFASAAFVMLDLDNLKFINDSYGHDFGDRYIRASAEVIVDSLRNVPHKLYGRRSGDEFYVLIYGNEPATKIRTYVNDLRIAFKNSAFVCPDGETLKIRVSGGVSLYPDDAVESGDMIKFADYAMYETKTSLKGEFRYFDRESYEKNSYLLNNKEVLYQLIENEDLDYYFQPIVRLRDGTVFAYEALMRPHSEVFGGPEDALRMARVHYKLDRMERLTIFKATQIFAERHDEFRGCKLFINSLPSKSLSDEDWELLKEMFGADLLKERVIEITENEQTNEDVTKRKLTHIRSEGSQFALDDYGKGYNGEAQLLSNRPDYIKLDMSLVRGVDSDRDRQRIVGDLVSFAHGKRILIIAEGVETQEELEEVIRLDCDFAQGFWLAKPAADPLDLPKDKKETIRRLRAKYYRD